MKTEPARIFALLALALGTAHAQEKTAGIATYASAPPAPGLSAGLLNDWLRQQSSMFDHWDLGAQLRARYEFKENGGSFPPQFDFRRRGVETDNAYLFLREKAHLGSSPCASFAIYPRGRHS